MRGVLVVLPGLGRCGSIGFGETFKVGVRARSDFPVERIPFTLYNTEWGLGTGGRLRAVTL